jgi:pimeloyl-ACP methyl ester carboxylesterase
MMILFQNKIIYMPYIPLGARGESIEEYVGQCGGVEWEKRTVVTGDGEVLWVACAGAGAARRRGRRRVVVLYFQGNAGSSPGRLPGLSRVLRDVAGKVGEGVRVEVVAVSYRGYWGSSGRAGERGIGRDLEAVWAWVAGEGEEVDVVVWGQSLGCGVGVKGVWSFLESAGKKGGVRVVGAVLETPFLGVAEVLKGIYPQRWLPYRYLGWALWNRWDMRVALEGIAEVERGGVGEKRRMLVLEAGRDEIVPSGQGEAVESVARNTGWEVERRCVRGALHVECMAKAEGRQAVAEFLKGVVERGCGANGHAGRP